MTASVYYISQEDYAFIADLVWQGFEALKDTELQRSDSKFYRTKLPSGINCYVKVFGNPTLFDIEWTAFQKLKHNDRFCPMLCSSKDFIWENGSETSNLHFIVKPDFTKFLDVENNKLVLLDNTAQLIAIAKELEREGWYDWDENWDNNAFDETGRLVRFDLDATFSYHAPTPKFNLHYHSPVAQVYYKNLNRVCEGLGKQDFIVSGSAIRTARFLLNRSGDFPELDEILSSLDKDFLKASIQPKWQKAATQAKNLISIVSRNFVSMTGKKLAPSSGDDLRELENQHRWFELWLKRFSVSSSIPYDSLSESEAYFLGKLWRHILEKKSPEFSLDDCYYSVLLLLVSSLQRQLGSKDNNLPVPKRMFDEMYELKTLGTTVSVPPAEKSALSEKTAVNTPEEEVTLEAFILDGGNWAATRKPNWISQDMVKGFPDAPYPFVVLADGVTNANGDEAAKIVVDLSQKIYQEMVSSPIQMNADEWIFKLVKTINDKLIEYRRKENGYCQTTLCVALLDRYSINFPSVFLAQFGDSPWVVIEEDEEKRTSVLTNNSRCYDKKLGVETVLPNSWITNEIKVIQLRTGKSYIRIYSDGISENLSHNLTRAVPINELVKEVESWGSLYPSDIGHDDWSIIGFDVEVKKRVFNKTKQRAEINSEPVRAVMNSPVVNLRLEVSRFKLSPSVMKFWQQTLTDERCCDLSKVPLIKEIIKNLPNPLTKPQTAKDFPRTAERDLVPISSDSVRKNNVSRPGLMQRFSIAAILFVASAFGLVGVMYYLYPAGANFHYPSESSVNNTAGAGIPTPSSEDHSLVFNDKETQELYRRLAFKENVAFDSLPGGVELNGEIFQKTIPRLAEIMRRSGWDLLIEVHTDTSGSNEENLKTAIERGKRLRQKLLESNVRDEQIKIAGLGKSQPLFPNQKDSNETFRNRRIVIKRLK